MVLFLQLALWSRPPLFINSPVNGSSYTPLKKNTPILPTLSSAHYFHCIHSGFTLANGVNLSKPASYNPFYFSIKCGYSNLLCIPANAVEDQRGQLLWTFLVNFTERIINFIPMVWTCPPLFPLFACDINYLLFLYTVFYFYL